SVRRPAANVRRTRLLDPDRGCDPAGRRSALVGGHRGRRAGRGGRSVDPRMAVDTVALPRRRLRRERGARPLHGTLAADAGGAPGGGVQLMAGKRVALYERLPEIYRIRDEELEPPRQLEAYLALVEDAYSAIHENIESLYHDLFVETADDWV